MPNSESILSFEENIVRIERIFDAPIQLVWEVWTNPIHIEKWWGPKGFTIPKVEFDFQEGSSYKIVMRSPDGIDYPVMGKILEIIPTKSFTMSDLVDEHPQQWVEDIQKMTGTTGDRNSLNSKLQVLFEETDGKTKVILLTEFANNQIRDGFAKSGMKEGWSESFEKLETNALPEVNIISIERKMSHPQMLIFNAFANGQTIDTWWGPTGFKTTTNSRDFKVGGQWKFNMEGSDGTIYPNLIEYKVIRKYDYLEYLHGSGDENKKDDFLVTINIISLSEMESLIKMKMTFPDERVRNTVIRFGAIEGGKQTLSRLNQYLNSK